MKRNKTGIILIFLAVLVLAQGYFHLFDMNLWFWAATSFFIAAIPSGNYWIVSFSVGFFAIQLLDRYLLHSVSTFPLYLAYFLACCGIYYLLASSSQKKAKAFRIGSEGVFSQQGNQFDMVFSTTDKYFTEFYDNLEMDMVFSQVTFYFDQAEMPEQDAVIKGDLVFSQLVIYLPKEWKVQYDGDPVFSKVKIAPTPPEAEKTLIIEGDMVFSELRVRYR